MKNYVNKFLSTRRKLLWGLTTVGRHCSQKAYWTTLLATGSVLLLPWVGVVLGFVATWRTYALGDEMQVPLWAWAALIGLPGAAGLLARAAAARITTQMYVRKITRNRNKI